MPLSTNLFDYYLPAHLIAQTPAERRDQSRLLVVDRTSHSVEHRVFSDLPRYLHAGDTLIRNNASVLPARLLAQRPTGGAVECFLLSAEPTAGLNAWRCLVRPGKKLPVGARFMRGEDFSAEVVDRSGDGGALVRFTTPGNEPIESVANRLGHVPLPPYIAREGTADERVRDIDRYQTVYANRERQVAVAAPTAGLHFTPELLTQLASGGVSTADITLHVGLGTFKPITTDVVENHDIHREVYEIPVETEEVLFAPTGRRVAVGTTSVRTIEDFLSHHAQATGKPAIREADIFIYPPRSFLGVDSLITNFHQPRSTLLCLVSAFLAPGSTEGIAWLREIYADAIAREYRFFSYGDAMLIL